MANRKTGNQGAKSGLRSYGNGLYLQRTGSAMSWVYRYMLRGRRRYLGLGSREDVSVELARRLAAEASTLRAKGVDPIDYKRQKEAEADTEARKAKTFDEVAAECIVVKLPGWKSAKSRKSWEGTLRDYASPVIGSLPVSAIDAAHVLAVLNQQVVGGDGQTATLWLGKPETANRVRGRIETVLSFAMSSAKGYRAKGDNPARLRGNLEFSLTRKRDTHRVEHHPAMPYDDLPAFMARLSQKRSISALALQFLILTATRTGETRFARWQEIDLTKGVWTIPAARTKTGKRTGKPHRVPLSDAALAVLRTLPRDPSGYVFARDGKPLSENSMSKVLKLMNVGDATPHGFRSTFRDWASEQTSFPPRVCEMALAHSVGTATSRAYERGDLFEKRAELMQGWATFCVHGAVSNGNVVPMKRKPMASAEA